MLRRTADTLAEPPIEVTEPAPPDTMPMGVVVFGEMRQWDPITGNGMSISAPYERILALCEAHRICIPRSRDARRRADASSKLDTAASRVTASPTIARQ
jgi:hypothetical protein